MLPMFFIFFIFLFFEIFSLARISNAPIKVESPGTQQHSRKGVIVLSLFVVEYLLERSGKVLGTILWLAYFNVINTLYTLLLPSRLHGHDVTWMHIYHRKNEGKLLCRKSTWLCSEVTWSLCVIALFPTLKHCFCCRTRPIDNLMAHSGKAL